jgi:putative phosphoribosyl transferase
MDSETTRSITGDASHEILLRAGNVDLHADVVVPGGARGLVIFAHGSGSSRHSPRNKHVAHVLQKHGFGTVLLDLLTPDEEDVDAHTGKLRFNIELLADRLIRTSEWFRQNQDTSLLPFGYFGASTGSAAALIAAAEEPENVSAMVSRGGRPDLAGPYLSKVRAPTLLIVGGRDTPVIRMNQDAMRRMSALTKLAIVPGATHLFEEPGALEKVAELATQWFDQYLQPHQRLQSAD